MPSSSSIIFFLILCALFIGLIFILLLSIVITIRKGDNFIAKAYRFLDDLAEALEENARIKKNRENNNIVTRQTNFKVQEASICYISGQNKENCNCPNCG